MPTVLDVLGTHLIGGEAAEQLDQLLERLVLPYQPELAAAMDAKEPCVDNLTAAAPASEGRVPMGFLGVILSFGLKKRKVIEYLDELPPSRGYEPFLVGVGCDRIFARGVAALVRQHGDRCKDESKWQRPVFDAINFLAKRPRQRRAILKRAKLLIAASEESTIIETIFSKARLNETEFLR